MSLLLSLFSCTVQKSSQSSTPVASGNLESNAFSLTIKAHADQAFQAYWDDAVDAVLKSWPSADGIEGIHRSSELK